MSHLLYNYPFLLLKILLLFFSGAILVIVAWWEAAILGQDMVLANESQPACCLHASFNVVVESVLTLFTTPFHNA